MSIVRFVRHEKDFVILDKLFIKDNNISLALKGLIVYCLSHPDDWKFHVNQMASVLKEKHKAIYSLIDEGIEHGYIHRENQKRGSGGQFASCDYVIFEKKQEVQIISPQRPSRHAVPPDAAKATILSIDSTKELPKQSLSSSSSNLHRLQPNRGELFENAAAASEGSQETIWYNNCQAGKSSITRSDIFQHFLKLNYPVEIIKASIEKFVKSSDPVRSPLKLLESIAERLAMSESSAKSYEAPPKPASSVYEPLLNPKKLDPKFYTKKAKDHAKSIF